MNDPTTRWRAAALAAAGLLPMAASGQPGLKQIAERVAGQPLLVHRADQTPASEFRRQQVPGGWLELATERSWIRTE